MEEKQSQRSLTTYFEIEVFRDKLPTIPKNKKMKVLLTSLSNIFRYKYEEEKAREEMKFWEENKRKEFLRLRDKLIK